MFTGLVEAVGHIARIEPKQGDQRLRIATGALDLVDVQLGDSIATNGVCLTVVELHNDGFVADVSRETVAYSTLANLKAGDKVNLEKALTLAKRLGGHLMSGHVDGVGEIVSREDDARSIRFRVAAPEELAKYIAHKGSICVDGVSLTVNAVDGREFELNIVPHTAEQTVIVDYQAGIKVNLEVDVIARYLERLLMNGHADEAGSNITNEFLAQHGFMRGRR
jgi:riboflavin synthase